MTQFFSPAPDLQISFHRRLSELRNIYLLDALLTTVADSDISQIDEQLGIFAPKLALRKVAGWGLRGEVLFPVPYILSQSPYLLGYYRLLMGFSQKQFYSKDYNFSQFKSMEEKGSLNTSQRDQLKSFCKALCGSAAALIEGLSHLDARAVHELTLLTLGPQLRGGALNLYGSEATRRVFELIKAIVAPAVVSSSPRIIKVHNAAKRIVNIEFAADPDIQISEELSSGVFHNLVAIEIKGGRDVSNIHNRIGEAEKSHQKARKDGFVECWTMVGTATLDVNVAKKESPSTDRFFNIDAITHIASPESQDFRAHLLARVGISD